MWTWHTYVEYLFVFLCIQRSLPGKMLKIKTRNMSTVKVKIIKSLETVSAVFKVYEYHLQLIDPFLPPSLQLIKWNFKSTNSIAVK